MTLDGILPDSTLTSSPCLRKLCLVAFSVSCASISDGFCPNQTGARSTGISTTAVLAATTWDIAGLATTTKHQKGRLPMVPRPDERYCWPMAERAQDLCRVPGLTEGACGKLREALVSDIGAVAAMPAGSPVYESHQMLRAKRTVLSARATTLHEQSETNIPSRAGTSAVLPRFADIRVSVSADFDVGSGLTFAFGYRLNYGVPDESYPDGAGGPRYGRNFATIERPMLVLERTPQEEGRDAAALAAPSRARPPPRSTTRSYRVPRAR